MQALVFLLPKTTSCDVSLSQILILSLFWSLCLACLHARRAKYTSCGHECRGCNTGSGGLVTGSSPPFATVDRSFTRPRTYARDIMSATRRGDILNGAHDKLDGQQKLSVDRICYRAAIVDGIIEVSLLPSGPSRATATLKASLMRMKFTNRTDRGEYRQYAIPKLRTPQDGVSSNIRATPYQTTSVAVLNSNLARLS